MVPHLGRDFSERLALHSIGQRCHRLMALSATGRLEDGVARACSHDAEYACLPARARQISGLITKIHQHVGELLRAELRKSYALGRGRGQHVRER